MSGYFDNYNQSDDPFSSKPKAQLPTPSLSPIGEHGQHGAEPFPSLDGVADTGEIEKKSEEVKPFISLNPPTGEVTNRGRRKSSASSPRTSKLSPEQLQELVNSPESLPVRTLNDTEAQIPPQNLGVVSDHKVGLDLDGLTAAKGTRGSVDGQGGNDFREKLQEFRVDTATPSALSTARPAKTARSSSTPLIHRKQSSSRTSRVKPQLDQLNTDDGSMALANGSIKRSPSLEPKMSPLPSLLPVPPLSLPTYLQLELSSDRPSALYIHQSPANEIPYESSKVKFERLLNFLLLPPHLEQVLLFGAIACLDAWLYTFTILPLRFLKAVSIFSQWVLQNATREARDVSTFVYSGVGRVRERRRQRSVSDAKRPSLSEVDRARPEQNTTLTIDTTSAVNGGLKRTSSDTKRRTNAFGHRRTKSTPSALLPNHKADILQGLLIISSCTILMWFDASRMYHSIRGQAAIKLYVIYNVLEVFDRLFSALGQDVLECLFSKETLERNEYGRSKIIRPLWMFLLALVYNVIHATALFYQVITLNVAVNSYSNALLTLLMSNQFVEIKGTVFKKFEKENIFQLTCADVVERFQLWLMLLIIALRNIVEVGGLSISLNSAFSASSSPTDTFAPNATGIPLSSGFVIPKAFTLFPKWTGEVLGPFLIVLGSEALVDWCKHAYINKFNNVKPNVYGRFLDVLAKDYYTHAFGDQNLTKRLGLPVLPLSCLFIRACMQTYHMFLATHMPMPLASPATSISLESETAATSPATTAGLQRIDHVFRRALGRSSFGAGSEPGSTFSWWSIDDVIAFATMCFFFLALWLVFLALKLLLGMALLSFARSRYKSMKEREHQSVDTEAKRVGRWATIEVNEDKKRWIYRDDPDGLKASMEREERGRKKGDMKLDGVHRYSMVAKRIW